MSYRLVKVDPTNKAHSLMMRNYQANSKHVQHASVFIPSSEYVLTVTVNGFFNLASVKSGSFELFLTHLESLPFEAPIRCAALNISPSPSVGPRIVFALGHDRSVLTANCLSGAVETLHQFTARPSSIYSDGDFTVAGDGSGQVSLWRHAASGAFSQLWTMQPQEAGINSLMINRHLVVSAAEDYVIVVQNVNGVRLARLPAQASSLSLFAFGASTHANTHPLDLGVVAEAGTLTTWERQGPEPYQQQQKSVGEKIPMGEGDVWTPLSVQQLGFNPNISAVCNNCNFLAVGGLDGEVSLYDATDSKSVKPLVGMKLGGEHTAEEQEEGENRGVVPLKVLQCAVTNDSHWLVVTSTGDVWRWPLADVLPQQQNGEPSGQQVAQAPAVERSTLAGEAVDHALLQAEQQGSRPQTNKSSSSSLEEPRPASSTPQPSERLSQQLPREEVLDHVPNVLDFADDNNNTGHDVGRSDAAPFEFDDDAEEGGQEQEEGEIDMMPGLGREPSPEQDKYILAGTDPTARGNEEEEVIYMPEDEDEEGVVEDVTSASRMMRLSGEEDGYSVATPNDAQTVTGSVVTGVSGYNHHHHHHHSQQQQQQRSGAGRPGTGGEITHRSASQERLPPLSSPPPAAPPQAKKVSIVDNIEEESNGAPPEPSKYVPRPSTSPSSQQLRRVDPTVDVSSPTPHHNNRSTNDDTDGSAFFSNPAAVEISVDGLKGGKRLNPRAVKTILERGSPQERSAILAANPNSSVSGDPNVSIRGGGDLTSHMLEQSKLHIENMAFDEKEYAEAHQAQVQGLMYQHAITSPRYDKDEPVYAEEVLATAAGPEGVASPSGRTLLNMTNASTGAGVGGGNNTTFFGGGTADVTKDTLMNNTVIATGGKRKVDPGYLKQKNAPEPKIDDHLCHDLLFGSPSSSAGKTRSGGIPVGIAANQSSLSIFLEEHLLEPAPPQQLLLPLPMAPTPSVF